jgi:hypothetical protein
MVRSVVIQSMPMDRARSLTCVNDLTVLVRGLRLVHRFRPAPRVQEGILPAPWMSVHSLPGCSEAPISLSGIGSTCSKCGCPLALVLRQMVLLRSELQLLLGFVLQVAQFAEASSGSSLLVFLS